MTGVADDSLSILRELEARDSRLHVFSRENRGLVPTLNELIVLARGRYLARMDSDDICRHNRFEREVAYLEFPPGVRCSWFESLSLSIPMGMPIMRNHE